MKFFLAKIKHSVLSPSKLEMGTLVRIVSRHVSDPHYVITDNDEILDYRELDVLTKKVKVKAMGQKDKEFTIRDGTIYRHCSVCDSYKKRDDNFLYSYRNRKFAPTVKQYVSYCDPCRISSVKTLQQKSKYSKEFRKKVPKIGTTTLKTTGTVEHSCNVNLPPGILEDL